jgi:predicted regulator of Ras-like GTPase activity (Roadblock/LC7/MglB family)
VNFSSEIARLVERCPGARGAAIVDPDGIPVAATPADRSLEALGTELAAVVAGIDRTGREFDHGKLEQLSVWAENAQVILTSLAAGYFLLLVLDRGALAGKGRLASRLVGARLYSEFV